MKKRNVIIISVLVVLVILLTSYIVIEKVQSRITNNPPGTLGNTPGNLQNGGLFCEDDGIVYFSNPYDGGSLYSMNSDETNIKKVLNGNTQFINSAGKFLYYYDAGSTSGDGLGYVFNSAGFFRYQKKSKTNPKYIKRSLGTSLALIDNYLYYQTYETGNHMSLYKTKIDGSDEQVLSNDDINPSCVTTGGFLYSQPNSNMHLQYWNTVSDSTSEILLEDVYQPVIDGNFVYYIDVHNNYGISRADLATGSVTQLIDGRVDCFNIANGIIYYQTCGDEYCLKSANADGSNVTVIKPGVYHNINITSNYVYFKDFYTDTPIYKIPLGGNSVSSFDAAKEAVK